MIYSGCSMWSLVLGISFALALPANSIVIAARSRTPKKSTRAHKTKQPDPQPDPAPQPVVQTPAPTPQPTRATASESRNIDAQIEHARKLYLDTYFGDSITELDRLLRLPSLTRTQRTEGKYLLALNFLALGNEERARTVFRELLAIDPDYTLSEMTPPKIRGVFNEVKKTFRVIPALAHNAPRAIDGTKGAPLETTIENMRPGYEALLYFRTTSSGKYSRIDLGQSPSDARRYGATIPAALLARDKGFTLEYYFVVNDAQHVQLVALREPDAPFSAPVSVPLELAASPVYKRWWFWTIIGGVAVAGAATAAALVLTQQQPQTGNADVVLRSAGAGR
jgi:hypothetical protein